MERRSALRTMAAAIAVLSLLAAVVWSARTTGFISDDAFISFRYARNLVEGNGLVFNPGERVEGYTNLLYVLLVAGIAALGVEPLTAGLGVCAVATTLAIVLTVLTVVRAGGKESTPYALGAGAALLLSPYVAAWTAGGLETTLFAALVMATALALVALPPRRRTFLAISLLGVALVCTRPEGAAVYSFATVWCLAAWGVPWRARARAVLPGAVLFLVCLALLTLWRLWYYGEWLPNTYYVKSALTFRHVVRGWSYVREFARNDSVLVAAVLSAVALAFARGRNVLCLLLLVLALTAQVVAVGGDGLAAYRFMVPVLPPLVALAALGLAAADKLLRRWHRAAAVVPLLCALALAGLSARAANDIEWYLVSEHKVEVARWRKAGQWLRANAPRDTVLATVPIGAVGYYSGLPVIDMMGLTDKHIARVAVPDLGSGQPGHEKHDGAYVLSRGPDLLLLGNIAVSRNPATSLQTIYAGMGQAVVAREYDVISHPIFQRSYRPVAFALGDGTFLHAFRHVASAR